MTSVDALLPAGGRDPDQASYIEAGGNLPLVSCILVVGDPHRVLFARVAVNQFVAQTYPKKQLIIVNGSGKRVTNVPHAEVVELMETPYQSIGDLRNIGMKRADGDFIRPCWDDDDCYPPNQLAHQMLYRDPNAIVLQTTQAVVYDVPKDTASVFFRRRPWGIENTMLVPSPKLVSSQKKFNGGMKCGEDAEFVAHWRKLSMVAVQDNSRSPQSCIFVVVYHGRNASPREAFCGDRDPVICPGQLLVSEPELTLINAALLPHRAKFTLSRVSS